MTARCFRQTCTNAPTRVLSPMPGVFIATCPAHFEAADVVARTGRPG